MRTVIWFIFFFAYLPFTLPALHKVKKLAQQGKTEEQTRMVNKTMIPWAHALLRLAGVTVEVEGLANIPDVPVLFVSNHQGNFDIPILLSHLDKPHGLLAKIELKKLPVVPAWMEQLHCVFIDRKNPRQAMDSLNQSAEVLRQGHSMIIFPEGTRSKCEQLGEFKSGALKIAAKTKVPLIPVSITGSYQVMEGNKNHIKPATVKIKVLPPIPTADLSREEFKALPERIRALILQSRRQTSA